jgi:hypothetical protein
MGPAWEEEWGDAWDDDQSFREPIKSVRTSCGEILFFTTTTPSPSFSTMTDAKKIKSPQELYCFIPPLNVDVEYLLKVA